MITCWRLLGLIEVIEGFGRDRPGWYSAHGKCSDVWVIVVFFAETLPDLYGLTAKAKPMRCGCMPSLVGGQACPSVLLF